MKALLSIETETAEKLNLLMRVAEEMGMAVEAKAEIDPLTLISEGSLAEDWNSPEDERWDESFAHLKK